MDPIRPTSTTPTPATTATQPRTGGPDATRTAQDFEAVFLGQMTRIMMESVEMGDEFSGGHGEEMFRGVMAEQLGTEMARRGGIGIAPMVMDQIIRMQGGGNGQ